MQEVLPLPEGVPTFNPSDYVSFGPGGDGAFGVVDKVKHVVSGDTYALKVFPFKDEEEKDMASNELEVLKSLNNENVVSCLGLYSAPGEIRILMELMDSDMETFMSKDEKLLAKIAVKVLSGLKYLKDNSILHMDIKPANLLSKSGIDIIKIADFGCSIKLSDAVAGKVVYRVGTRPYGAPEIYCNGGITLSATPLQSVFGCDIFSFGISMLYFFRGKLPFTRYPAWDLVNRNALGLPHFIQGASENFQNFLDCCLHKDPAMRSTVEELLTHPFITEASIFIDAPTLLQVVDRRCFQVL